MSSFLGRGQAVSDTPTWDGEKWILQQPSEKTSDGASDRYTLSWGLAADTTSDFTAALTVAGSSFGGILMDGHDIWVCDYGTPLAVTRVDWTTLQTDLVVDSTSLGFNIEPVDVTCDGLDIVIASTEATPRIVRVSRTTGAHISNFVTPSSELPLCIDFDGEKVWFLTPTGLYRIDNFAGPTLASPSSFTPTNLIRMVFDGRYLWVADRILGASQVYRIDPFQSPPTVVSTYSTATRIADITFDGTWIWTVSDNPDGIVVRIHVNTGVMESIDISTLLSGTTTIGFNGLSVFVAGSGGHVRLNPVSGRPLRGSAFPGGVAGSAGSGTMASIGVRSLLLSGGGTTIYRCDQPLHDAYIGMLLGTRDSNSFVPQLRGDSFSLGVSPVSGTTFLLPKYSNSAYIELTGSLSGATRIEPYDGVYWVFLNSVTLNGHALSFGTSGSNIDLGALGTVTMVRRDPGTDTFVVLNVYP